MPEAAAAAAAARVFEVRVDDLLLAEIDQPMLGLAQQAGRFAECPLGRMPGTHNSY